LNYSTRNQAHVKDHSAANRESFERWGLPYKKVMALGERLSKFHGRFHDCFATQTNNKSDYARVYLQGLLWMEGKRNYTNIARRVIGPEDDGQSLQHFMSDSPWSGKKVFEQIQFEIAERPELSGGMLSLDETGVACSGKQKAGTARQYLGREGKVDLGQVGVGLSYYKDGLWTLVDAELYLPHSWFGEEYQTLHKRWHVPPERTFQSKPALGLEMIKHAQQRGLPFQTISCDSLYGRDSQFRAELDQMGLIYMADIPENVQVYLSKPEVGVPQTPANKQGRPYSQWAVLNRIPATPVRNLAQHPDFALQTVRVRYTERGWLMDACAAKQVYTITDRGQVRKEWLFIREEKNGSTSYSLSNAPGETHLHTLALWRSQRYFVERTFQDAKTEAGWDELMARKYRAWIHHAALDALALWFVAETKLDWALAHPRDPNLVKELGVDALPNLSMANIRELLRAVLPLKRFTPDQAIEVVIQQLINRARSTQCRLRAQCRSGRRGFVT